MVNFINYVFLVVILSVLLGMAGINTGDDGLLGGFMDVTIQNATSNFSIDPSPMQWRNDSSILVTPITAYNSWRNGGSPLMLYFYAIIFALVIALGVRTVVGGTFGIAETIKTSVALAVVGLMLANFISLLSYINTLDGLGGTVKIIAWLI